MKFTSIIQSNFDKIPTRFDDIQKEIQIEKMKKYFEQKTPEIKQGNYFLGDVCGKIFNKVV